MRKSLLITATAAVVAVGLAGASAVSVADEPSTDIKSSLDEELLERTLDAFAASGDMSVIAQVRDGDESWS
ncbi:MAG: serine hydrolase domain-containing protein, partial [Stackebrandtia sp.]